jgi:phosphohistidine phosphatase
MLVVLFRHGPAGRREASRWPDDALRPLTGRGAERTRDAVRGLGHLLKKSPLILTSPLVRAAETAEILSKVLEPKKPVEVLDALRPGGSLRAVVRRLETCGTGDVVILVGHEPDLGKLAGTLVFGAPATGLPLSKSGACVVTFVGPVRPGEGRLHAFLPPRLLRRFGKRKKKKASAA